MKRGYPLPEICAGRYLLTTLSDLGWCGRDAHAIRAITHQDLLAYSQVNQMNMEPWECRAVLSMSSAFVCWHDIGTDEIEVSPMEIDEKVGFQWM